MALTLQQVFPTFNNIVKGRTENDDLDRKMRAVNQGNEYLIERMLFLGQPPYEYLTEPTNLATTTALNYATLPTDYFRINDVWRKDGSRFYKLSKESILTYEELKRLKDDLFFDITDTGDVQACAAKGEERLYFDRFFSSTESDRIKIDYFKRPDTVTAYDQISFTGLSGTFVVGETVTGGTSSASAEITTVNASSLFVSSEGRTGSFIGGETLTGSTSSATATADGDLVEKPQTLEWSNSRIKLVSHAWAVMYLELISSSELPEKSDILDALILQASDIQRVGNYKLRLNRY